MIYTLASDVEIIISEIDYEFVLTSRTAWYVSGWGYIVRHNKTMEYLHILIAKRMGLNTDNLIDHENRNKVDNSRLNLRESDKSLNALNHKILSSNTSGITGVCFHKCSGKYRASIGKTIVLGYFDTKEDAIRARLLAESKIKW